MLFLLFSACPRYSCVLGGPRGVPASLWGFLILNFLRILEVHLEERDVWALCSPFLCCSCKAPQNLLIALISSPYFSSYPRIKDAPMSLPRKRSSKQSKMEFCKNMAKVWDITAVIWKIPFMCLFCDSWCGSNLIILEIPVFMASANKVTAWFGFYEEGVLDALPSAHTSLESPQSFGISGLSWQILWFQNWVLW